MLSDYSLYDRPLAELSINHKLLITTLNAHSFNVAEKDADFKTSLIQSDVLIPDGVSVVWAVKWLYNLRVTKIAGADLFFYEMERLEKIGGKCFFLGSTNTTLQAIKQRAAKEYPNVLVDTYSPPYKPAFTQLDNQAMLAAVNSFQPDVLFVGMTAPKQEKWAYEQLDNLQVGHIGCIGAVFDFYAGTVNRAPKWMIGMGLEWLYRLVKEPKRMWRRYLLGNFSFVFSIVKEKITK